MLPANESLLLEQTIDQGSCQLCDIITKLEIIKDEQKLLAINGSEAQAVEKRVYVIEENLAVNRMS